MSRFLRRTSVVCLLSLACISVPLISPGNVAGQEMDSELPALPEPVNDSDWEAVLKRYEDNPTGLKRFGLSIDILKTEAAKWSAELGLDIEIRSHSFIAALLEGDSEVTYKDEAGVEWNQVLSYEWPDEGLPGFFYLEEYEPDGKKNRIKRVPSSKIAALRYPVVSSIVVKHPLNKVVPTLEVGVASVDKVCQLLCEMAGVDFSVTVPKTTTTVGLKLTNRTVAECLTIVTDTVSWTVDFGHTDKNGNLRNAYVDPYEAWETVQNKEYLNAVEDAKIETLLDAYRYLVFSSAEGMRTKDLMVRVSQPSPAEAPFAPAATPASGK